MVKINQFTMEQEHQLKSLLTEQQFEDAENKEFMLAGKDTLQRFHRMRVCFFFTFYPVDSRKTECFTLFIELLWGRL